MTSPKLPPIAVQYTGHVYHVTTIPQCFWRKLLWRHTRLYRLYIRFGIILTQFYINFSRQEHQIDVIQVSFKTWDSQVSAYTPFHFSFTVPLNSSFEPSIDRLERDGGWLELIIIGCLGRRVAHLETKSRSSQFTTRWWVQVGLKDTTVPR